MATPETIKKRAYNHARYLANKEQHNARSIAWRKANQDRVNQLARLRNARHPEKVKAANKKWRDTHPKQARDASNRWRLANPEAFKALQEAWKAGHPGYYDAKAKEYYDANPEYYRALSRRYNAENPEKRRAAERSWARRNMPKILAIQARRRARKMAALVNDLTAEQRQRVLDAAKGVCMYCQIYNPDCEDCMHGTHILTADHITAIAVGGSNTLHNLFACCQSCNSKKGTKTAPVYVQPLLL